jgi:2-iminoacetate synthase ThiH
LSGKVRDLVAKAIRDADRSFFNEDYTKQAANVLSELRKAGYEVVPTKAPPGLVKTVSDNMPMGRHKPSEYLEMLYQLFVENAKKHVS